MVFVFVFNVYKINELISNYSPFSSRNFQSWIPNFHKLFNQLHWIVQIYKYLKELVEIIMKIWDNIGIRENLCLSLSQVSSSKVVKFSVHRVLKNCCLYFRRKLSVDWWINRSRYLFPIIHRVHMDDHWAWNVQVISLFLYYSRN